MGRPEEALAEVKRALELDPLSLIINRDVGRFLYYARRYDQSIEQSRKTLEMEPNFPRTNTYLGLAYLQKGMPKQALEAVQKESAGSALGTRGYVYGMAGREKEALDVLAELQRQSQQKYVLPSQIALVYTGLGDKEQAFAWLEKAVEDRSFELVFLKVDACFDSLRSDPRFPDLLKRMGLPQ